MFNFDGLAVAPVHAGPPVLPMSATGWDLVSFLSNATDYTKVAGGALLVLLGTAAVVWGAVKLIQKLWGNQQSAAQISWVTIILLIVCGGALMTGGFAIVQTLASGGQDTIEELGGGTLMLLGL